MALRVSRAWGCFGSEGQERAPGEGLRLVAGGTAGASAVEAEFDERVGHGPDDFEEAQRQAGSCCGAALWVELEASVSDADTTSSAPFDDVAREGADLGGVADGGFAGARPRRA